MINLSFNKEKPLIMGILNVTPDSFYDGGRYISEEYLRNRIITLVEEGADIIDIGGESSRPGADPVPLNEELQRVELALSFIDTKDIAVSIDTCKAPVAEAALSKGAIIVNDISGLRFDPDMVNVVRKYNAYIVIMHMKGSPKDMQNNPEYTNVIEEIMEFFKERVDFALSHGIEKEKIILDPGIGFGKKQIHNITILQNLKKFASLGFPLLIGHSRKSIIGYLTGENDPNNRLYGTLGISAYLIMQGVEIIRVHDVKAHVDLIKALIPFKNIDNSDKVV